ncbi:MAG: class I SAM-dependent methyltransferase [Chloroflexi bacterium]|nr:class I SAM-dependent methyltransferase [Chloroflexota bacterium]
MTSSHKSEAGKVKQIKDFYDRKYFQEGDNAFRPYEAYPIFLSYLEVAREGRLLDIGCGNGFLLRAAEKAGLEAYGIDISEGAAEVARLSAPLSEVQVGKAEELNYPEAFFDYITCLGTLEHCLDIDRALGEITRVAKDAAKLCIVVPNLNYVFWEHDFGHIGTEQRDIQEQLLDYSGWVSLLTGHGLAIQKVHHDKWFAKNTPLIFTKNPRWMLARAWYRLRWLFMPLQQTYQFVFICTKDKGIK